MSRLGITQYLIQSGIVRLEEVRDGNGKLENLYVRVRFLFSCHIISVTATLMTGRSIARSFQRKGSRSQTPDRATSPQEHR